MADWASEKKQKYFTRLEELKSVGKPLHFGFLVFHLVCVNFLYVGVDPVSTYTYFLIRKHKYQGPGLASTLN